jgi:hypothetical protein
MDVLTVSATELGIKMALLSGRVWCMSGRTYWLPARVCNSRSEPLGVCHCRATRRNIGRSSEGNACGVPRDAAGALHEVTQSARCTS